MIRVVMHIMLCNNKMYLLCPPTVPFPLLLSLRSEFQGEIHLSWIQTSAPEAVSCGSDVWSWKEIGF